MRRLSFVLGSLLVLAFVMPVSAATVDRYKLVYDYGFVDFTCGFMTLGDVTLTNEYEKDFYDNDGTLVKSLINGRFQITYSNPVNGKSSVENVPGSGHFDYVKNEFFLVGRNGVSAQIYTGHLDLSSGTLRGHIRDEICPALA